MDVNLVLITENVALSVCLSAYMESILLSSTPITAGLGIGILILGFYNRLAGLTGQLQGITASQLLTTSV